MQGQHSQREGRNLTGGRRGRADLEIIETGRVTAEAVVLVEDGPVFTILHNICCHPIYYS